MRGETMKIILRAAMAALSFHNIGSAYAGESQGAVAKALLIEIDPGVLARPRRRTTR